MDSLPAESQGKPQNTGVGSLSLLQGSSWPRNWTGVSCIAGGFFTNWASLSWDYKYWRENRQLSPACQEVGLLHLQRLYYLYSLLFINSVPSEMLYLEILFQPELGLPWQSSRRAWAAMLRSLSLAEPCHPCPNCCWPKSWPSLPTEAKVSETEFWGNRKMVERGTE